MSGNAATMTKERLHQIIDEALESKFGKLEERLTKAQDQAREARVLDFQAFARARDDQGGAKKEDAGINCARYIIAMVKAARHAKMGQPINIVDWSKKEYGAESPVTKALSASNLSEGGALIPVEVSSDIIPLLRPASAVDSLNPVFMPMPTGKTDVPKVTGGASASYIGENDDIPKTQQSFGMISLVAKKLAALVPISNDLLLRTTGADTIVRDDTVAALAQRGDLAKIRGDGSVHSPRGLRHQAAAANLIAANATVNLANVTEDLKKVFNAMEATNAKMLRPAWIFSPRTKNHLMFVRDANGNLVWHDEMKGGTLLGFPFRSTTQIPNNLGGGLDESEVYFADFADVVVGETGTLRVDISTDAAYLEGGILKSAFSLDQTIVRVIQEHDLGVRYDGSIVVLTAVKWT